MENNLTQLRKNSGLNESDFYALMIAHNGEHFQDALERASEVGGDRFSKGLGKIADKRLDSKQESDAVFNLVAEPSNLWKWTRRAGYVLAPLAAAGCFGGSLADDITGLFKAQDIKGQIAGLFDAGQYDQAFAQLSLIEQGNGDYTPFAEILTNFNDFFNKKVDGLKDKVIIKDDKFTPEAVDLFNLVLSSDITVPYSEDVTLNNALEFADIASPRVDAYVVRSPNNTVTQIWLGTAGSEDYKVIFFDNDGKTKISTETELSPDAQPAFPNMAGKDKMTYTVAEDGTITEIVSAGGTTYDQETVAEQELANMVEKGYGLILGEDDNIILFKDKDNREYIQVGNNVVEVKKDAEGNYDNLAQKAQFFAALTIRDTQKIDEHEESMAPERFQALTQEYIQAHQDQVIRAGYVFNRQVGNEEHVIGEGMDSQPWQTTTLGKLAETLGTEAAVQYISHESYGQPALTLAEGREMIGNHTEKDNPFRKAFYGVSIEQAKKLFGEGSLSDWSGVEVYLRGSPMKDKK